MHTAPASNNAILNQAATQARGLAIDAVHACNSGHLGLPLGCAEIGAVLYGNGGLRYNPAAPKWLNRDRFVLSGGHGSMFLYSWLHLAGYDLALEEVKNFRVLGSETPGHPEFGDTAGVEATTGPLGQGIANAVGYALSGKRAAAKFNTAEHTIFDHHVLALNGDGCLQEGVAKEAIAFAGHNQLDNLILIYDSNDVTLDAMADRTQSEDARAYFLSQGWDAITIDGHDLQAITETIAHAKSNDNGKPGVIIARTEIAHGIPEVAGTAKGHGEGGAKFAEAARKGLGLPQETFFVSAEVRKFFADHAQTSKAAHTRWEATYAAWKAANPVLAAELENGVHGEIPTDLLNRIPPFDTGTAAATRATGGTVIQYVAREVPHLITGSADLYGSTKNYIKEGGDLGADNYAGRNIWFGIREHAMGAICNGIAYDGIFRVSGATFLVFADYMRPSIRLASLAKLPVTYIFTHDSVGVGEDGPTHQPVETVSGLRVIPNLDVIRPSDAEEVAGAYVAAMQRKDGPTALIFTRQSVPANDAVSTADRRQGVLKGGYIAKQEAGELKCILMATGSEVQHAIAAANQLGDGVRVVSIPCFERFDRQPADYIQSVLPGTCTTRVAVEAGVSSTWGKYVGLAGKTVCIDRFGLSAPGGQVMEALGITADNVATVARQLLQCTDKRKPTLSPGVDCPCSPRLAAYCKKNRAAHPDWFNAPVPCFGDEDAELLIVGLAPGLKGANRTGRPFTGDAAGKLLFAMLDKFGFSNGTYAGHINDGVTLTNCMLTNAVRCVPPQNKPTAEEINTCRCYLKARIAALPKLKIVLSLGKISHDSVVRSCCGKLKVANTFPLFDEDSVVRSCGDKLKVGKFKHAACHTMLAHAACHTMPDFLLVDSYHCSQLNINRGRLTEKMFEDVFAFIKAKLA